MAPMWQRLPVLNLSFSRPVLTVTECLQHNNLSVFVDRSRPRDGLYSGTICAFQFRLIAMNTD
jgi:hypothetical protein